MSQIMKFLSISLVILMILGIIIHYWSDIIKKLMKYKIYFDKNKVFVDDNVKLVTEISNRKIIPIPWISIEIEIPLEFKFYNSKVQFFSATKNMFTIITSLLFFEKLKRYHSFKCSKRGVYRIKTTEITIGDFLGVVNTEVQLKTPNELIVYPKINELNKLIDIPKSFQGNFSVKRWIINDPTQIVGVRKYNNSDGFNTIHWKSTAKNGELYVKKFDFTADPSIMFFLDIQTEENHLVGLNYDFIEKGIDIVASLMDNALKEKIGVGYTANSIFEGEKNDVFIYPINNSNQKIKLLEALAKTTYRRTYRITNLLNLRINDLGKYCTIILLLSYISKELNNSLNYYSRIGYNIKIILLDNNCYTKGLDKNIEIIYSTEKGELMSNV